MTPTDKFNLVTQLTKFIDNLELSTVNHSLVDFKVPLGLTKLQQLLPMLPQVKQFYLIFPLADEDIHSLIKFIFNHLNLNFNVELLPGYEQLLSNIDPYINVTNNKVFITDDFMRMSSNPNKYMFISHVDEDAVLESLLNSNVS